MNREKYEAMLADLVTEKAQFLNWANYYDRKIAELRASIEEKFGGESGALKPLWAPGCKPQNDGGNDEIITDDAGK